MQNAEIAFDAMERVGIKAPQPGVCRDIDVLPEELRRAVRRTRDELEAGGFAMIIQHPRDPLPVLEEVLLEQRDNLATEDRRQATKRGSRPQR